ncbi:hypothetical protein [Parasitella parasitica]|uniref:F-box domain-containing protein n=1 Tax=Parasitella parasitica TaxID=35722 RepID=A0A0B7N9Z1_9FUNG|nr:hypothetical protein [Parasitella parasitica]
MSNYNNSIPLEIWMIIFSFIKSPKQLLQCRLVCKKWDYPAETAMFSKNLEIDGENSVKLYNHLAKKSSRSHLVRAIDVDICSTDPDLINLLKVSFNPKMQHFASGLDPVGAGFFAVFLDIIKSLPKNTAYSMCTIPEPVVLSDRNYARVAYTFRRTLQHLQISANSRAMNTYLRQLKVFRSLITLKLDAESVDSVEDLDVILKNCPYLQELELTSPDNSNYAVKSHDTIAQWAKQSVTKVPSLEELTISFAHPDLVDYLMYKYPNVSCFMCEGDDYQHDNALRVLTATKNVRSFETSYYFERFRDIESTISAICSVDERPTTIASKICYRRVQEGYDAEMRLMVSLEEQQKSFQVNLDLAHHLSSQVHLQVLESWRMHTGHCPIRYLEVNLLNLEPAPNEDMITFYDIVDKTPVTERIDISVERIQYEPMAARSNQQRKLSNLNVSYAVIDSTALAQISEMFPDLNRLTLRSCCILDNNNRSNQGQAPEKVYNIYMPYSSFFSLNLVAAPESNYGYRGVHPQIRLMTEHSTISGYCYLRVSVLQADVHMYCRLKASSPPVFLTQQEFETRPYRAEDATVCIICANLVSLRIDLVGIVFDFHVKNYVLNSTGKEIDNSMMELESGSQDYSLMDEAYQLELLKKLQLKGQIWKSYTQDTIALEKKPLMFY